MADTTFIPGTVVHSSWLNAVNRMVYDLPTASVLANTGAGLVGYLKNNNYLPATVGYELAKNLWADIRTTNTAAQNSAAISVAMATAFSSGGGTVNLPAGDFTIDSMFFEYTSGLGVNLVGRGREATILRKSGATTTPILDLKVTPGTYPGLSVFSQFSDFTLIGNGTCTGIRTTTMATFDLSRINVRSCALGWDNQGSLIIGVNDITVNGTGVASCTGVRQQAVAAVHCNSIMWYGQNTIIACNQWGMDISDGYQNNLKNINIEFCGSTGNTNTGGMQFNATMAAEIGYAPWVLDTVHFESCFGYSVKCAASNLDLLMDSCMILAPESNRAYIDVGIGSLTMRNMTSASPNDLIVTAAGRVNFIGGKFQLITNTSPSWEYNNILQNTTLISYQRGGTGNNSVNLGGTKVSPVFTVPGSGNVVTNIPILGGTGGAMIFIRGAESASGVAYTRLYLVAIRTSGGAAPDVAAVLVSSSGNVTPSFTFANSGGFLQILAGTASNGVASIIGA